MFMLLADALQQQSLPDVCPAEYRRMAPQTFCLVTGIIAAWLIFSIFLSDKNYLVFKIKRAFQLLSVRVVTILGVTRTVA